MWNVPVVFSYFDIVQHLTKIVVHSPTEEELAEDRTTANVPLHVLNLVCE